MKARILTPNLLLSECVLQFSTSMKIDRSTFLTVPNGYKGFVYINEKLSFRVDSCNELNLLKEYGKDLAGENVKVCFILTSALPVLSWGFGNIDIKNDAHNELYKAGANGKYALEIEDYGRLISTFAGFATVTIDDLKEKTISIIKTKGAPILNEILTDANVSVFNAALKVNDLKDKLVREFNEEKSLKAMGLKLSSLTVEGIHINSDDLERIKSRIA